MRPSAVKRALMQLGFEPGQIDDFLQLNPSITLEQIAQIKPGESIGNMRSGSPNSPYLPGQTPPNVTLDDLTKRATPTPAPIPAPIPAPEKEPTIEDIAKRAITPIDLGQLAGRPIEIPMTPHGGKELIFEKGIRQEPTGGLLDLARQVDVPTVGSSLPTDKSLFAGVSAPPSQIYPTTIAPGVVPLLTPTEVPAFEQTAIQEEALQEAARQRLLMEQQVEQYLFAQQAIAQQQALENARARYLQEEEAAVPTLMEQFRNVYRPEIEKSLFRAREQMGGAQGLGAGGFGGSGALQELALRGATRLEEQAGAQALQNLLSARQNYGQLGLQAAQIPSQFGTQLLNRQLGTQEQFRGLGLEAAQTPSIYRRAGLERGLSEADILAAQKFDRELAAMGVASQSAAAARQAKAAKNQGLGSVLGGIAGAGLGSTVPGGTFLGGMLGSQIGSGLGGFFG